MIVLSYISEKCWTELAAIKTPRRHKVHQLPIAIKSLRDISFLPACACTNEMHLTTTASSRSFLLYAFKPISKWIILRSHHVSPFAPS